MDVPGQFPSGWEVWCNVEEGRRMIEENGVFAERLKCASGMYFMLVEANRVVFCGDYAFKAYDARRTVEQVAEDCERAMSRLAEEGLQAVKAITG